MLVAEWDHFMCFTCRELGTIRDPFQPAATALVRMKYSHGKTDPGNLGMLFAWLLASAPSSISILALLMGVSIHLHRGGTYRGPTRKRTNVMWLGYGTGLGIHQQRSG